MTETDRLSCPPRRVSEYFRALRDLNERGGPKPELTQDEPAGALILTYPNTNASTEEPAA